MIKRVAFAALVCLTACSTPTEQTPPSTPEGREAYELARLQDPETGQIPEGIRMRELAFAATLPRVNSQARASKQIFQPVGPYNVGGRTRALAYDQFNPEIILAGAVSGGMWRSTDSGQSWSRVTTREQHAAVSCVVQDTRTGKTDTWYYGSGERVGNSASKLSSATYRGSGIYKSTDNGMTWSLLTSTETPVQTDSDWTLVYRIALDPTRNDSDIVLAATKAGIVYSNDGGATWKESLSSGQSTSDPWSEITVTTTGVFYAAISSNANNGGIWRSEDGLSWSNITAAGFPATHERTVLAIAPSNEDVVYSLSVTPGFGQIDNPNDPTPEYNSLWKYTYVSSTGAGFPNVWEDRSVNLPSTNFNRTLTPFGGYCYDIAVKPDNENVVFLGGTNMFRSTNGFATANQTNQIGGYRADGNPNYDWVRDNHHPDLQYITFHPNHSDRLLCSTDGGMHFTQDCMTLPVIWESYNNGFISAQFYAIAVDNYSTNTAISGGLQDNGTWGTDELSATEDWSKLRGADGAYTAITGNGLTHYVSTQYANIERTEIDQSGNVLNRWDAMPDQAPGGTGSGYLFVHPFTLDPANDNIMYLPFQNQLYANTNLANLESGIKNWSVAASLPSSGDITSVGASLQPQGVVYAGFSNRRIYRLEDTHTGNASFTDVSQGITSGSFAACVAVDPRDADKVAAVYSNYNAVSLWYSEDGGQTWTDTEGNLKGNSDPGVPPQFAHIGDGPSFRWLEIIPISNTETVYLLGTSIGLFATDELDGDNTVWVLQAADVIGNVVVDMIDHRTSDGFTAIGTHGNGVFTTYIQNDDDITSDGLTNTVDELQVKVFPNPAVESVRLQFELQKTEEVKASILDLKGRQVMRTERSQLSPGTHQIEWNVQSLPSGTYFIRLKGESMELIRPLVKQ